MLSLNEHLPPMLCGVADTARTLGIGRTKTYQLISDNLLETVTIGSRRLVKVSSIKRLIETANMGEAA
jgi:excisionase family DNA binding protein